MVAPSGEQHEFAAAGYRAVVTECGASLRVLEHDGDPLVLGWPEDGQASSGRGQLLAPWPNRIRDGRYTFDGVEQQLPLSEPGRGNASHGLVRWTAWSLVELSAHGATLSYRLMGQTGYPWALDLQVVYDLSAAGLTVTTTATNLSRSPAPYAVGAHPYLSPGPGPVDGWELTLPAATRLVVDDERKLPTGREDVRDTDLDFRMARPIRSVQMDTAFTDLTRDADGRVEVVVSDPASGRAVTLWMDEHHRWVQVFTGDGLPAHARESLAVEPLTAPPDAFNSGDDLTVLQPAGSDGDTLIVSWGVHA